MTDIWLSPTGNDSNAGRTRQAPLRTLAAAWDMAASFATTGWRINLLPGVYPYDEAHFNDYADRLASAAHPLILQAANGAGTATIAGGLNLRNVRYLYLLNLTLAAGGGANGWGNNVLHLEAGDHVLVRGCTITGLVPADFQEVLKANQCRGLYVEDCDISGSYQAVVDFVSTQYGHLLANRIHDGGEWACYAKGGSAYLRIEGNELDHCGLGLQTGEGAGLEFMVAPWLHYEAYDIKVVNNVLHDIEGVGLSAAGGYNILFAHNTLYRVGISTQRGYVLAQFVHGSRSCDGNVAECQRLLGLGAWGTAVANPNATNEIIPNKHVFVYNNLFYNPAGTRTMDQHFDAHPPAVPGGEFQNVPNPSLADDDVRIAGNIVFNGPADLPLGLDNATHIDGAAVLAGNTINVAEPQLRAPAAGDYRPTNGGNVATARGVALPSFGWGDAPTTPLVPSGLLANSVPLARDGTTRVNARPGAY
ncbi:MAG: right-handed parallel beta-helix repeat-containing protein [Armatimonadetes bacterium]|nr:right-handed parallel beta-helix repeat-containing protein [Armatimonadota bacterium]